MILPNFAYYYSSVWIYEHLTKKKNEKCNQVTRKFATALTHFARRACKTTHENRPCKVSKVQFVLLLWTSSTYIYLLIYFSYFSDRHRLIIFVYLFSSTSRYYARLMWPPVKAYTRLDLTTTLHSESICPADRPASISIAIRIYYFYRSEPSVRITSFLPLSERILLVCDLVHW